MGENSKIEWTDHTFNPWVGCTKVHEGCRHCYAETLMDHRYGKAKWGPNGTRNVTSDANWRKPVQWNKAAEKAGVRARVFCASLADVFEDRPELVEPRKRLFDLIDSTPWLDWLLLTKRPENVRRMWPAVEVQSQRQADDLNERGECYRRNVWLGTSPCDQPSYDKQVHHLERCRDLSPVLFLSIEPLLGRINMDFACEYRDLSCIDWVIVGGESGTDARPMHPDWVRSIRDQCLDADTPFFFKQWGEYGPEQIGNVRFTPVPLGVPMTEPASMFRVGKTAAGRTLDGQVWDSLPEVPQ